MHIYGYILTYVYLICVFMDIHTHVCLCIFVYIHVYLHAYTHTHVYACMYLICVNMYINTCLPKDVCIHTFILTYIDTNMCDTWIYVPHKHINTHVWLHTYIHKVNEIQLVCEVSIKWCI